MKSDFSSIILLYARFCVKHDMVDSSFSHVNATLFVSQCFQTFLSFNNASDAEGFKKNADLSKHIKTSFLKFVFDTVVEDLKESERRSKRDPNEHPVFFYDIFEPDFDLDQQKVFENFFVQATISNPPSKREQSSMNISYNVPLVKFTGHARHKDILPIRNGVYYPSETYIELWNFSLKTNLSSEDEEKSTSISKYNVDDCRIEFFINIKGTERYPKMPEDRLSERLKDILCRKAVPETVNSPFNQLLRFLGVMATDKSGFFEAFALHENLGVEEAVKFLKDKEAEFD